MLSHFPYVDLSKPYTLWAGIIGGAFLTTASHGTDQLIVQTTACGTKSAAVGLGAALERSGDPVSVWIVSLGRRDAVCLLPACRHRRSARADRIYPTFIVTHMPRGIAGLLIAAILAAAMSNLSAALEFAFLEFDD